MSSLLYVASLVPFTKSFIVLLNVCPSYSVLSPSSIVTFPFTFFNANTPFIYVKPVLYLNPFIYRFILPGTFFVNVIFTEKVTKVLLS